MKDDAEKQSRDFRSPQTPPDNTHLHAKRQQSSDLGTLAIAAVSPNMGYESDADDRGNGPLLPHLHTKKGTRDLAQEQVLRLAVTVLACASWMGVSSALILVNKHCMSVDGFVYPMALSGLGMAFSGIASTLCCKVFRVVEVKQALTWHYYCTRIVPVGLFMALTLYCGNVVYLYLSVAFIQMLKAFTPIVTMVALFVAGLEAPTSRLIAAVFLIALGTAVASYGELQFSLVGVAFMFASESFEAIRLVMTQMLLVGLKLHPIEGLMYLAPACTFWLLLGMLLVEWPSMQAAGALSLLAARPFLYLSAAGLGFLVNTLAYFVIQLASSLTLKVLGTVKNAGVMWIGVLALGETVTLIQGVGYAVSLVGFFWYNYVKIFAGGAPPQPKAHSSPYMQIPSRERSGSV
ncbi:hypothetical protein WJX73_004769 [Symbiochloris irregularis]|uniref:Sugar phosphate transporter domain-containing protein n=1 Tax=Symbiochloris irregularis TaxID=706552 RepID=A0AAW1NID8_9CHLO